MGKKKDEEIDDMIIEEIEASIENLTEPEDQEYVKTLVKVVEKMKNGGEYTKEELKALDEEMTNFSGYDFWSKGKPKKRLEEVMAKFGFLEEYDPLTYYTSKPKTREIYGKRWVVG